jgi:hydrogenase nickel incorporation protein HypA/HybF
MHELSITQNILTITLDNARKAEASKVSKVNVVIGEMSGIVGDCVDFYFKIISKDTPAAEAELAITNVPTLLKCRQCGNEYPASENNWTCPDCEKKDFEIIAGRDLYIESIEVE